ncbi:MAG TPA: outer membrane beta-barrel domain-containing protein [Anaeromyxobacter sp.]|nr:outer membrane beta-barrel domain-containing protein [Anaeromyxobacter sp.]
MSREAPHAAPHRRAVPWAALSLAALVLAGGAPRAASAQSKSDAFAGKIPPVSAPLYRKAGRYELTLSANLSVNDAFYSKYFGGLKLGYHFTESLSAHAFVTSGLVTQAGSAQVCPSNGGCHSASRTQMWQVPGNIRLITGLEGAWAPVYGKLNVFSERVGHFDLSLIGGLDWISYQRVVSSAGADALAGSGGHPPTASTLGGHLGLGTRIFFAEWVAARLEFRDYIYRVSVPNWQENGGAKRDLQNQLFTELGVSFFFPTQNRPVQ